MKKESRHSLKIRLTLKIRSRTLSIAGSQPKAQLQNIAKRPLEEQALEIDIQGGIDNLHGLDRLDI